MKKLIVTNKYNEKKLSKLVLDSYPSLSNSQLEIVEHNLKEIEKIFFLPFGNLFIIITFFAFFVNNSIFLHLKRAN